MINRHYAAGAAIALINAAVCSGATITLSSYTFTSVCEGISSPLNAGCSVTNPSGTGNVQYGLNSSTGPFVSASNSSTNAGGNTSGELLYQIEVTGPGSTAQVDVNFLLLVSGGFSPIGNDQGAQFTTGATFNLVGLPIANASVNLNAFGGSAENGFPPSFTDNSVNANYSASTRTEAGSISGPQTLMLTTGIAYTVDLKVQANCLAQGTGVGCATSATIDPTFSIDAGQAGASQYSIVFSPGVGNGTASAVPEPSSFVLCAGGLLGLCIWIRRRRADEISA